MIIKLQFTMYTFTTKLSQKPLINKRTGDQQVLSFIHSSHHACIGTAFAQPGQISWHHAVGCGSAKPKVKWQYCPWSIWPIYSSLCTHTRFGLARKPMVFLSNMQSSIKIESRSTASGRLAAYALWC